jgi:iron complex transport system substrate-binding protein
MKTIFKIIIFSILLFSCKKETSKPTTSQKSKIVQFAKGFSIERYKGYSILKVSNPWPKANKTYTYILKQKNGIVPDSLKNNTIINVPISTIVVTSTTHIPSLEMLGKENTLVGFPNLDYISSEKIRKNIDNKKVEELGNNQDLNIEKIINLNPSVIVGYGIDNSNPTLDNLQKSGLKVLLNGDWNEETPLGKAEWIKFFGALFGKEKQAAKIFDLIASDYLKTKAIASKTTTKPTAFSGSMFQDVWYMPSGNSWGSLILRDANCDYLWQNTSGTGSLNLSFETVLERAQKANFWIGPGQFNSLTEIESANKHYTKFEAFRQKNVFSSTSKKGKTGGILYYELAPNRPDLVLKDIVKIIHPELLPGYKLFFFEKLQ